MHRTNFFNSNIFIKQKKSKFNYKKRKKKICKCIIKHTLNKEKQLQNNSRAIYKYIKISCLYVFGEDCVL